MLYLRVCLPTVRDSYYGTHSYYGNVDDTTRSQVPNNDVSVNDGQHIRRRSYNIK